MNKFVMGVSTIVFMYAIFMMGMHLFNTPMSEWKLIEYFAVAFISGFVLGMAHTISQKENN